MRSLHSREKQFARPRSLRIKRTTEMYSYVVRPRICLADHVQQTQTVAKDSRYSGKVVGKPGSLVVLKLQVEDLRRDTVGPLLILDPITKRSGFVLDLVGVASRILQNPY